MADYYTPTVVQPSIPVADMTLLERLILTHILDGDQDGEAIYFYSETGPAECFSVALPDLREAISQSASTASFLADYLAPQLANANAGEDDIDIDLTDTSWEFILRDIVKRSQTIGSIRVISSYTCSCMRPDGFGGSVAVITADGVLFNSTYEMEAQLLDRARRAEIAADRGVHVYAQVSEADVRAMIAKIVARDPDFAGVTAADVTDTDIGAACTQIFAEERDMMVLAAAVRALCVAQGRVASRAAREPGG